MGGEFVDERAQGAQFVRASGKAIRSLNFARLARRGTDHQTQWLDQFEPLHLPLHIPQRRLAFEQAGAFAKCK
ncbi:hypothetical protein D3C79_995170 [compost metagenome]